MDLRLPSAGSQAINKGAAFFPNKYSEKLGSGQLRIYPPGFAMYPWPLIATLLEHSVFSRKAPGAAESAALHRV